MSHWQIEDAGWQAIMADPQLAPVRRKLSFHEIRLIVGHARRASAIEAGTAETAGLGPKDESAPGRPDTDPKTTELERERDELMHDIARAQANLNAEATARIELQRQVEVMREAGQAILERMGSTFKAKNGRDVGIEAGDGEKIWLVHSDDIERLRAALSEISSR